MSIILPYSYSNYCYIFQNFKPTVTFEAVCWDIRNDKSVKEVTVLVLSLFNLMLVTAVCVLFLIQLRWPKKKCNFILTCNGNNGLLRQRHIWNTQVWSISWSSQFQYGVIVSYSLRCLPSGRNRYLHHIIPLKSAISFQEANQYCASSYTIYAMRTCENMPGANQNTGARPRADTPASYFAGWRMRL